MTHISITKSPVQEVLDFIACLENEIELNQSINNDYEILKDQNRLLVQRNQQLEEMLMTVSVVY